MIDVLAILLLQPLMVIYQAIFDWPNGIGVGGRIIFFSIVLNLVLSPLYREMEVRSRAQREKAARMMGDIVRMKTNFKGRERYFYIRAVHRQYGYHPIQAVFASSELFVQIFTFATVYYFLSHLDALHGAAFGRIADLGKPDGLLRGINLLPLLMTAINAISVLYYVKERGKRMQAIVLAFLFLFLLYGSPAGLVLYWTMNNFWSLLRNMLARVRERNKDWQWAR